MTYSLGHEYKLIATYCPNPQIQFTANTNVNLSSLLLYLCSTNEKGGLGCLWCTCLLRYPNFAFPSSLLCCSHLGSLTPVRAVYPQIYQGTCRVIPINTVNLLTFQFDRQVSKKSILGSPNIHAVCASAMHKHMAVGGSGFWSLPCLFYSYDIYLAL